MNSNNDIEKIRKEIFDLQAKISAWDNAYYNLDSPEVPDEIYDVEFNKLKALEEKYASFFSNEELKNSPTKKINALASDLFKKVKHKRPMLSLNKAYSLDEIQKFIDNIKKITSDFSFFIEPKIDGLSISIIYEDGKLVRAITRGDGITGEDVTANVVQMSCIPKTIEYKESLEVRGEVYLAISDFEKLNLKLGQENKNKLANPRNAAAGTLRQLNSQIIKERNLSAFLYYVVDPLQHNIKTMQEEHEFLKTYGFPVTHEVQHANTLQDIEEYIRNFKNQKLLIDYETDGVVIKLNEVQYFDKLGSTAKFPHYAIAFKYEPNVETTTIKRIYATVGRTGLVTYNAELEPVEISGSLVSFATLNNFQYIKDLNLNENDLVYIKKAGEIIPCVIGLISGKKEIDHFQKVEFCPYCHNKLVDSETGLEQFCSNDQCPEIQRRKLIHFCSKDGLDINTMGERNIDLFLKNSLISNPIDIFNLKNKKQDLLKLNRMGEKSIENILISIDECKNKPLYKMISALSIPLIGVKLAKFVASKIKSLHNLLNYDFSQLIDYHEIGDKIINSIISWISNDFNKKLVEDIINLGYDLKDENESITNLLENKSFVITGTLGHPRSYFERLIEKNGGLIHSSISSKTNYLLAGENAGSKLQKANKLNITIITEEDLFKMIGQ